MHCFANSIIMKKKVLSDLTISFDAKYSKSQLKLKIEKVENPSQEI